MRKEQHHAEVYLGQHLGVRSEHPDISGYFTAQESLWSASGVKVYEHNGSTLVEVDFGRKKVDYAYSPVADEDLALEAETLCYVKEQPWRYRELLSASIRDVETDEKLDLVEELPSGWKVYLDLVDEPAAWCLYRDKAITLAPRFANEFCYHSLAHEVGHAWGSIHNPHLYQNGGSKVEQYARDIACERNAHEYALLKLKPFLSSDNDDPFNDTSFRGNSMLALQTYTDGICDKIEYEQSRRERVLKSVKIGGFAIAGLVFTARSIARR